MVQEYPDVPVFAKVTIDGDVVDVEVDLARLPASLRFAYVTDDEEQLRRDGDTVHRCFMASPLNLSMTHRMHAEE